MYVKCIEKPFPALGVCSYWNEKTCPTLKENAFKWKEKRAQPLEIYIYNGIKKCSQPWNLVHL